MESKELISYKDVDICHDDVTVLSSVDLTVAPGDFIYLLGKVGSGKSSFLKSLYAEIPVESGEARIFDYDLRKIKRTQIPFLRRKIGIIFQDFQLLPDRNVFDNLAFVLRATGWKNKEAIENQVIQVLEQVGMERKAKRWTHQLSGGEQQRIAIARALLNSPELILADEPTGNLDSHSSIEIMALFQALNQQGITIVLITHEPDIAQFAKRCVRVRDGLINSDELVSNPLDAIKELAAHPPLVQDGAEDELEQPPEPEEQEGTVLP